MLRRLAATRFPGAAPLALGALVLSCGGEPAPSSSVAKVMPPAPTAAAGASARPAYVAPPARFENPGGMWMPSQIPAHAAKLKELGLAIDPRDLSDPTSGVLSAVVSLGGCSASFVSPDGLVITNHHCATGALQQNSTPQANLTRDGFLAKSRGDERNNGPTARVFVTRALTDVTARVREGALALGDDLARARLIERRGKEIVAACEKSKPGTKCSVVSFYEGAAHYLVEQMEIRDVRLVWAPPAGVGNFGGEIDNWRWPRHGGDVSIFRAYVGKDGNPADFAPENVPYHPPHSLKIAHTPLQESDLVLVAGYPGRTDSLKTAAEVNEAVTWVYPRRQRLYEDYLAKVAEVTKNDPDAQIRSTSLVRGYGNYLTKTKGLIEGLASGGLAQEKAKNEQELRAFIDADPARKARYGTVIADIGREIEKGAAAREADAELEELRAVKLLDAAQTIVRMAEERAKPDAERDPEYQERNWPRVQQKLAAIQSSYSRKVDEALLALAVSRARTRPEKERSAAIAKIEKRLGPGLYDATTLGEAKVRGDLLDKATAADLRASKDPLIALALELRPLVKEADERRERLTGRFAVLKPRYIEALREMRKEPFAPDANSTLRITYGTVRGYRPSPDAPPYRPFTTLSETVAKNKGAWPFDVPQPLLAAQRAGRLGPYVDQALGDVPVDFLADLHITGGNSGSATLDARGDLVGLVFDGNYEAMASDWVFQPAITRSIHVDIRYVLWMLDAAFGGDAILKEMGVTPRID
ncbi:MAG: hypothetical protein JWP97_5859 [Labilithrix sp.]|nr:hypothetical protein [Labilithrix sp.]